MSVLLLPDEENRLESGTPEIEEQPEKRTSVEVHDLNIVYFRGGVPNFTSFTTFYKVQLLLIMDACRHFPTT